MGGHFAPKVHHCGPLCNPKLVWANKFRSGRVWFLPLLGKRPKHTSPQPCTNPSQILKCVHVYINALKKREWYSLVLFVIHNADISCIHCLTSTPHMAGCPKRARTLGIELSDESPSILARFG